MIFIALLPLLVIAFFMGAAGIRQVSATEKISFNVKDFFFLAAGFACFIFGINNASVSGWLSAPVIAMLIAAVFALAVFCRRSRESDSPLIRMQVFHCAPFTLSVAVIVSVQFICLGAGFLIPNYAQLVMGENAFTAGCLPASGLHHRRMPYSGSRKDIRPFRCETSYYIRKYMRHNFCLPV